MARPEPTWTIKEIAMASGKQAAMLYKRRQALGMESKPGYTLDEAKKLIKFRAARKASPAHANALKAQLINDGIL